MSSSSYHEPGGAAMWDLHSSSISAWAPMISNALSINDTVSAYHPQHHLIPDDNSAKSCEVEDKSMASSALTVESSFPWTLETTSSNELLAEPIPVDTHHWSHTFLSNSYEFQNHQYRDVGANLVDSISTKSMRSRGVIFESSACDYLKMLDSNNNCRHLMDDDEKDYFCSNDRPTRKEQLSSAGLVVGDWSIAPRQDASTFPNSNTTAYDSQIEAPAVRSAVLRPIRSLFSSSFHTGIDHEDFAAPDDHHRGDKLNVISLCSQFSKPLLGVDPALRPRSDVTNHGGKKSSQRVRNSLPSQAKVGRRSGTRNEGKRKRGDEESCSESGMKKQKHEYQWSTAFSTSSEVHGTKVKFRERIGNLQQIVSPFGKTDIASVLVAAILHIKLLQGQVQLLFNNPYLKIKSVKEDEWDRKDVHFDLTSRGLCLIPVSHASQVCCENHTRSNYWTPPYTGMFYRS